MSYTLFGYLEDADVLEENVSGSTFNGDMAGQDLTNVFNIDIQGCMQNTVGTAVLFCDDINMQLNDIINVTDLDVQGVLQNLSTGVVDVNSNLDMVTNDIVGVNTVKVEGTYQSTTMPRLDLKSTASVHPGIQLAAYDVDNSAISFDSYLDGTNWVSSDVGSNFQILKLADKLQFRHNSGTVAGGTAPFITDLSVDTAGKYTFVNDTQINGTVLTNVIEKRNGTDVTVSGISFEPNHIEFPNGFTIDDTDGDVTFLQFDNKDHISFTRSTNLYEIAAGNAQPMNPDLIIGDNVSLETRIGIDTIAALPFNLGKNNATSVICHVPLVVDEIIGSNVITMSDCVRITGTYGTANMPDLVFTSTNNKPGLQLMAYGEDNQSLSYSAHWNGVANVSTDIGSQYQIAKFSDQLNFRYNSGAAVDSTFSYSNAGHIDTSGDWTFDNNVDILGNLDVTGTITGVTFPAISRFQARMEVALDGSSRGFVAADAIDVTEDGTPSPGAIIHIGESFTQNSWETATVSADYHEDYNNDALSFKGFTVNAGRCTMGPGTYKVDANATVWKNGGSLNKCFQLVVMKTTVVQNRGSQVRFTDAVKYYTVSCSCIITCADDDQLHLGIIQDNVGGTDTAPFTIINIEFNITKI